jgi:hypothetical protein
VKYDLGKWRLKSYEVKQFEKQKAIAKTKFMKTSEALKRLKIKLTPVYIF